MPSSMNRKILIICAVVAAVVIAAVVFYWPRPDRELQRRGIPPLPKTAQLQGKNSGGLFASWLFLSARLPEGDYEEYKAAVMKDCDRWSGIPDDLVVVVLDDSGEFDEAAIADDKRIEVKPQVNGEYLSWWTTEQIQSGGMAAKDLGDACQYQIFFDDARRLVFLHWSYS